MIGVVIKIAILKPSISQSPERIVIRGVYICQGKVDTAANKSKTLACKNLAEKTLKTILKS